MISMNAYDQFKEVRELIGETTAKHWSDRGILRKLNQAQGRLWMQLCQVPGDWMLTSTTLTASNSLITLPSDCGKPVYLEEASTGREIPIRDTVRERRLTRPEGTTLYSGDVDAYMLDSYIEVNQDSYGESVKLWYLKKPVDLAFGTAGANCAASALHFDTTKSPRYENDYYNSQSVVVMTSSQVPDIVTTITDYVASTAIATITGTPTSGDFYGTVSILPGECHYLMCLVTANLCLMKPSSNISEDHLRYIRGELKEAMQDWTDWVESRTSRSHHTRITEFE